MISPGFFCDMLAANGTDFFTGVPDSLLKSFCSWVTGHASPGSHICAVNEGAAVALAAGYHLAVGKIPLVYMQNSGIGNAVNPLLSLADGDVYAIPMVLLVGWRGEPGVKDEPQHVTQGRVTCALFDAMGIPYRVLADNENDARGQVEECYAHIRESGTPFALIVRKDTFAPYAFADAGVPDCAEMSREEAIGEVVRASSSREIFVSTTGMASRELYELREKYGMGHERDFLTVGSMGHASSLALAIALQRPERLVTCIDGDGAALMHLGGMATVGERRPKNLRHIILNNCAHDSVGGQPTIAGAIDFCDIARSCGYARVYFVKTAEELRRALGDAAESGAGETGGAVFIEVSVRKGSRKDLGRPKSTPRENKAAFMGFIAEEERS